MFCVISGMSMYLFLFWGWQTIRFFNLASSNQTDLAGFTLVDGKIPLFFYYMFCASSVILLPSFERHGLVVDGVQEKVMDNFLRKKGTSHYVFFLFCTSSSSWGGTLKRESWEIWYLLHKKIMRGRHRKKVSTPPDLILLSKLEELLLLLADHLERVDERTAPVQRVPCHQDKGGLCASGNERSQFFSDKRG